MPSERPVAPLAATIVGLDLRSRTEPLDCPDRRVIVLDDPLRLTLVESGQIDVFAVPLTDGRATGRWTFLFRLGPGALIPGGAPGPTHQLLIRPSVGTRLAQLRARALADLVGAQTGLVCSGLDQVFAAMAASLRGELPPREFVPLSREQTRPDALPVPVPEGGAARSIDGVQWVRIGTGSVRLGDVINEWHFGHGETICVTERDWLIADRAAELTPRTTWQLARSGELWHQVVTHTVRTLFLIDRRVEQRDIAEADAARRRADHDSSALPSTAGRFESVLQDTSSRMKIGDTSGVEPALAAARLVAAELGFAVTPPVPGSSAARGRDRVQAIALASGARTRTIRLDTGWWRKDLGPFVARHKIGGSPVAALRVGGRYVLVEDGRVTPINGDVASQLAPKGTVLYPPLPENVRSVKGLLRFGLAGHRSDLWRFVAMATAVATVGLVTPVMTGRVLGTFVSQAQRSLIVQGGLLVVGAAFVAAALSVVQNIAVLRIESRLTERMQAGLWSRLLSLPASFFSRWSTGALGTAVLGVNAAQELLAGVVTTAALGLITGLANLVLVYLVDLKLAVIGTAMIVLAALVAGLAARRDVRRQRRAYSLEQGLAARVFQLLTAVPKLRVAAAEDRAFAVWADEFADVRRVTTASRAAQNRVAVFNAGFPVVATLVVFLVVGGPLNGAVPVAAFLSFFAAFNLLTGATLQFTAAAVTALAVVPMFGQLAPILAAEPELTLNRADPGDLSGRVNLSEVSFRYGDGPAVLDKVSLHISEGEFVAIVGPSGSGKSTLLRLLLGFEKPTSGSVQYDGQDLNELDVSAVRRQCGVVLQNGGLFAGDIKSNIIGSTTYTVDDAWIAAEMAGLAQDIKAMPMGMSTVMSEGSSTLSGGQRQRLMIARALIGRPRIVFFDEATSALDNPTQREVAESTRKLNAARVVIAHRLSSVAEADRIIVLDRGRVVQEGTYASLLAQNDGLFAHLARRQRAA